MALDTSSSPTSTQPHAAPTLSATNVDVTPEKTFFQALWSKVVDVYTSTFKADERIDRLQKMPAHEREVAGAVQSWEKYSEKVDASIRADVETLCSGMSKIVRKSAEPFLDSMDKLNSAYKEITGYTAAEITPDIRKSLTIDQRVKLSNIFTSLNSELAENKAPYVAATAAINEVGNAVTDLVDHELKLRNELKIESDVKDATLLGEPSVVTRKHASFRSTNLLEPHLQALAPDIEGTLQTVYAAERSKIFKGLASSEGVTNGSLEKMKEAVATAKGLLEGTSKFMDDVVTHAVATTAHIKKNKEIREDILSGVSPTDPAKKVAYVSKETLDTLKNWFETKSNEAERDISASFAAVKSKEELEKWRNNSSKFGLSCEQYKATLKAVGEALHPFTPLVDATRETPGVFQDTVNIVKHKFEETALHFVTTLPHEQAMEKLKSLAQLSARIAVKATADHKAGATLTDEDQMNIVEAVQNTLIEMAYVSKSWV